jgi:hypothetical protein
MVGLSTLSTQPIVFDTIPKGQRIIVWRRHALNIKRKRGFRTICEVLREIWADAEKRDDTLTMARADEASDMAKRMQKRLIDYAGSRHTLVHFDDDYRWIEKEGLMRLTPDEITLVQSHREAKKQAYLDARAERKAKVLSRKVANRKST